MHASVDFRGEYMLSRFVNCIILLFIATFCLNVQAFEIGVGASFTNKYLSVLDRDGKELAAFEGDTGLWPYFSIKSHDKYFGESDFGYFYYGWYAQSAVEKVKDHRERVLPAPVNLQFLYAGATIFYVLGEKEVTENNGYSQHAIGIGAGWGASRISGDIPAAFMSTASDEHIDSSLTGSSANIFYRYLWGSMFLMIDVSTVEVINGTRKYQTSDGTLTLGRYFDF